MISERRWLDNCPPFANLLRNAAFSVSRKWVITKLFKLNAWCVFAHPFLGGESFYHILMWISIIILSVATLIKMITNCKCDDYMNFTSPKRCKRNWEKAKLRSWRLETELMWNARMQCHCKIVCEYHSQKKRNLRK